VYIVTLSDSGTPRLLGTCTAQFAGEIHVIAVRLISGPVAISNFSVFCNSDSLWFTAPHGVFNIGS
jgi:hypothetical protein